MQRSNGYDYLAKALLVGDPEVGKTELLNSMVDDMAFSNSYETTIGMDFKITCQETSGKIIKLQIWDTSGQERFLQITRTYYLSANVILLCYDVTNKESFENLSKWQADIGKYAQENVNVILVGIKSDLKAQRAVTTEEAQAFAEKNKYDFKEVSNNPRTKTQELRQLVAKTFYESLASASVNKAETTPSKGMPASRRLTSASRRPKSSSPPPTQNQSRNLKIPGMILLASSAALWLFSSPATLAKVAFTVLALSPTYGQLAKAGMVIGATMTAYGFFQSRRDSDDETDLLPHSQRQRK